MYVFGFILIGIWTSRVRGFVASGGASMERRITKQKPSQITKPQGTIIYSQKNTYATIRQSKERRMTHEEQQSFLRQTVEMRRINKLKSDMTLQAGGTAPFTLALAKAAGYGEELDLLECAIRDGERAREALVTGNMGLVYYCVNDVLHKRSSNNAKLKSLSKEDLVQEGAIGLARAVDRWNMEIGGKFSTYAVYWIRASVLRCIAERDDFVRVPEHVLTAVRKVSRAAKTLGLNIDEFDESFFLSPEWKEAKAAKAIAEVAGLSEKQLLEAIKVRERRKNGILSFESWMQTKNQNTMDASSVIVDDSMSDLDSPYDLMNKNYLKAEIGKFLRPKEMEALSWRYGLNTDENDNNDITITSTPRNYLRDAEAELFPESNYRKEPVRGKWGEAMSFAEVGNKMHVSAEYGRKLCHIALAKLQRAVQDGSLELAFLF